MGDTNQRDGNCVGREEKRKGNIGGGIPSSRVVLGLLSPPFLFYTPIVAYLTNGLHGLMDLSLVGEVPVNMELVIFNMTLRCQNQQ